MAIEIAKSHCKPSGCGSCYLEYGTLENSCEEYLVYKKMAESLYNAGYRKQSEGEWIEHIEKPSWLEDDLEVFYECSICKTQSPAPTKFCPNCGAKMKGGAE